MRWARREDLHTLGLAKDGVLKHALRRAVAAGSHTPMARRNPLLRPRSISACMVPLVAAMVVSVACDPVAEVPDGAGSDEPAFVFPAQNRCRSCRPRSTR